MATMTSDEIRVGPLAIRFLVEAEESGGSVSMFEFDVPSQAKVPIAHSHDAYEETLYGLSGVLTWTVDGETHEVGPGDVLCIPRGVVHKFENEGEVAATNLAIVTPGVLGPQYFRDLAALVEAAAGGPPDPTGIVEVMRRHGLTPAPPA
jgi:quercetin dioxygenase-like cupin family protein